MATPTDTTWNKRWNRHLSVSVDKLELSTRARNCLETRNIRLIGVLVQFTEHELLLGRNFGQVSLNEIRTALAKRDGLELGLRLPVKLRHRFPKPTLR